MAFIFEVKVIPGAGCKKWKLDKNGILKCFIKSPAEQGRANAELIKDIARSLGINQDLVTIVFGSQSRKKKIKVDIDLTYDELLVFFGIHRQMDLFNT